MAVVGSTGITLKNFEGMDKLRFLREKLLSQDCLRVGFLGHPGADGAAATYPNEEQTPVALVAYVQEYGSTSRGIPPRPFFRNAVKANGEAWSATMAHLLKSTKFNVNKSLAALGQVVRGDVQESIAQFNGVPLSQVTLMLRMMKKLNTTNPFGTNRRVTGADITITGKTVGIAARLVAEGKIASGVSTKQLIEPTAGQYVGGVMLAGVDYEVASNG